MDQTNTLYIKSPTGPWIDIATRLQKRGGLMPRLWISSDNAFHHRCQEQFPETSFIAHNDMLRLQAAPDQNTQMRHVVDVHFLDRNAAFEPIFYNMMDRWCSASESVPWEKSRAYYIGMANQLLALYQAYEIGAVILPTVPHRLYDYMAYLVARHLGIPFIMIEEANEILFHEDGSRSSLYFVTNDMQNRFAHIQDDIKTGDTPSPDLARYIATFDQSYEQRRPAYNKDKERAAQSLPNRLRAAYARIPYVLRAPFHVLKRRIETGEKEVNRLLLPYRTSADQPEVRFQSDRDFLRRYEATKKRAALARQAYNARAQEPDLNAPFIYFAASFQPERSSTPDAGLFQWTELMIEMLAAHLPEGWKIYFKEHPSNFRTPVQADNTRYPQFYDHLQSLCPDLTFIPLDSDPLEMIGHAKGVATSTGTTAWQAVTSGVPAIIFGEIWYQACAGIYRVSSHEDMAHAVSRIAAGDKPSRTDITDFLCAVEKLGGCYDWARGRADYPPQQKSGHKHSLDDLAGDILAAIENTKAETDNPKKRKLHA